SPATPSPAPAERAGPDGGPAVGGAPDPGDNAPRSGRAGSPRNRATATTIWIIDDHPLVASALAHSLHAAGHDARVGPLRPAPELLAVLGSTASGLVLLDLELGRDSAGHRIDGATLVGPLRAAGWLVLVLTDNTTPERIGAALAAGAAGAVSKTASFTTLLAALHVALAGHPVHRPTQHRNLIDHHQRHQRDHHDRPAALAALTGREREILQRLAVGQRAQTIAAHSLVSVATVRAQIRAVLTKLGVHSQLEAVALYTRHRHREP
ncbi:MAG: LuxR C-terminal-related transcriptional regulator, partial [Actinomycetota bacterium]|nr:LuxR C-terminal-related transcriptional regulator [Actinomycetota bacterium]